MEASRELGVDLRTICGGQQTCGKCKVRIEEGSFAGLGINSGQGHLSLPTQKEVDRLGPDAIAEGYRLACAATIAGDLVVYIPEQSRASTEVSSKFATDRPIPLRPAIRKCYVELSPPSLETPRGDWENLSELLAERFGLHRVPCRPRRFRL